MTNSPPANVKSEGEKKKENRGREVCKVLASGIDTLVLALDVTWKDRGWLDRLARCKELAKAQEGSCADMLAMGEDKGGWLYDVQAHGSKGYEWLVTSNVMDLTIGNWMEPQSRPGVLVRLRSETLWARGAKASVELVGRVLTSAGAEIVRTKVSRADVCTDLLVPAAMWGPKLGDYRVTRADSYDPHFREERFTGMSIGQRGHISARIYDKAYEIAKKSKKFWMFDVWGLKEQELTEDKRMVRVEFELHRERLKSLGIDGVEDLWRFEGNLWAYCSQEWLRFESRPGLHHTQRKVLPWWAVVQEGYAGAQDAEPLVAGEAAKIDKKQLTRQLWGLATSLAAAGPLGDSAVNGEVVTAGDIMGVVRRAVQAMNLAPVQVVSDLRGKLAKYHRKYEKLKESLDRRAAICYESARRDTCSGDSE